MAELAWCPTCEKWDNLELREAVCDKNGNSICQMCGTTLEEGSGMIETKILSNIQAIERLREIGFRVEIIGYAKDELMEPYQAVIYDPSYQERSWGAFGSTIGEAVDGAIAKFKLEMQNKLEEVKQRYREADEKYVASLRKWREAVGTPLEDITWQESRRAYWNMRKAIREFYEAQYSCQV